MRPSVLASFPAFTGSLEGVVPWPYADIKGIATAAEGNAFFTEDAFAEAGWSVDGRPATSDEMAAAWDALQAAGRDQAARPMTEKWIAGAYASLTPLRLSPDALADLVRRKLLEVEATIRTRFGLKWDDAPADAQLATLATAWAEGAYGLTHSWPKFDAAFVAQDWTTCATECHLDETNNHGLILRNVRDKALFLAAQAVADSDGDFDAITGWAA